MAAVESEGYASWIANQMAVCNFIRCRELPYRARLTMNALYVPPIPGCLVEYGRSCAGSTAATVAFALSEIMVISDANASLADAANGLGSYYAHCRMTRSAISGPC